VASWIPADSRPRKGLEESLGGSEALVPDGDDLTVRHILSRSRSSCSSRSNHGQPNRDERWREGTLSLIPDSNETVIFMPNLDLCALPIRDVIPGACFCPQCVCGE
jgi:hypothetical protein